MPDRDDCGETLRLDAPLRWPGGGVPVSERGVWCEVPAGRPSKKLDCNACQLAGGRGDRVRDRTFFFCGWPEFLTRFRLLITSVLSDIGRGRPCSFRKSPQALQSTEPASSRRHSGVVEVVQFWQTGWAELLASQTHGEGDEENLLESIRRLQWRRARKLQKKSS